MFRRSVSIRRYLRFGNDVPTFDDRRRFTSWIKSIFRRQTPTQESRAKRMEVTSKNFAERLPLIESSIDDSIFVSIDGEFTGLNCKDDAISGLDTPAERYAKVQKTTTKFLLVQFGLTTFHYDHKKKAYSNRAFNFYVWPRPFSRAAPDSRFLCQASSLDFLSKQNFDFNKLIRDGISYLKSDDEKRLREAIDEKRELRKQSNQMQNSNPSTPNFGLVPVPEDQKKFLDLVVERVETWTRSNSESEQTIYLERCSPFQRKLIYQTLKTRFGQELYMETVDKDKDKVIAVSKVDSAEQDRREAQRDQNELDELDAAVGFAKVIKKISSSNKLVVGHNMLLDLCFTLNQFVTDLPPNYTDFKLLMQTTLPKVCDTKLMASTTPFREEIRNSSLEGLLMTVKSDPYKIPEMVPGEIEGYSLGESNEKYHEAGYDAFITGLCFIAMSNRLGLIRNSCPTNVLPDSPLVAPFFNKLHLMMSNDIPYMNLAGKDLEPNRDDVFHLTFPAEWTIADIQSLFFPFGGVFIYWLSDTTAFVRLREPLNNSKTAVPSTLNGSCLYNIIPYAQFKAMEATYGTATGITPTMEKARLSFSPFQPSPPPFSPQRQMTPRLPVRNMTGPTFVAKSMQQQQHLAVDATSKVGFSATEAASAKKRSLSPEPETRKRNKSVEDPGKKNAQTFEEPPWD